MQHSKIPTFMWTLTVLHLFPCRGGGVSQANSLGLKGWTQICNGSSSRLASAFCAWSHAAASTMAKMKAWHLQGKEGRRGTADTTGWPEAGTGLTPHGEGPGGKRFQTLQDTCGLQSHCQSHGCYQSVPEGELEEILQRQKAQASWAVAQDDTWLATHAKQAQRQSQTKNHQQKEQKLYPTQRFTVGA